MKPIKVLRGIVAAAAVAFIVSCADQPVAAGGAMEGKAAPALQVNGWINSPALDLASLKGKVVVLDFWAYW